MAGYTKADFDALYSIRVRVWDEAIQGYRRSPVRLNYHRAVIEPLLHAMWDRVVPLLGITAADRVLVVGAGFGWGADRLAQLTGCQVGCTDLSDYVMAAQATDEEADIDAAIIAAGYDPLTGHGAEVRAAAHTTGPRANRAIMKESVLNNTSRTAIKTAFFGGQDPTWLITEDMITDFSDAEIDVWKRESDKFRNVQICHLLHENSGVNPKTAEAWAAYTGHTVITLNGFRRVG